MKLQKIIKDLQRLHPREIDLDLSRIKKLCSKLGNPQDNLNCVSIIGTNGKYSTIQAIRAILSEANLKCNIYTSPHIQNITERFIFNNKEISKNDLADLLYEVESINNKDPITFFEILTAAFFYGAKKYSKNITLVETGLFHKFDATNILKKNLANVITAIGLDHLDWLPKNQRTIDKIIFEKTSSLLPSTTIISKQVEVSTQRKIAKSLQKRKIKKIIFNKDFTYLIKNNKFFHYKDKFGNIKLPFPNVLGNFQLANISSAIAVLKELNLGITNKQIKNGITKIKSIARLQEIKKGKLKDLVKNNKLLVDGSHNPLGAKVLVDYLDTLDCKKHMIVGMMDNKNHKEYFNFFKGKISSLTTINIPNNKNAIERNKLKNKLNMRGLKVSSKVNIYEAIKSIPIKKNEIILITGSLYLAGEVLNLN